MPTAKEFAREVDELALTITGYQNGKSGQNGLCDCIGLIMGAMTRLGRGSYPMHSTNYFARYQMDSLRILSPAEKLAVGQLVYKADDNQSDLNDRYKAGGRYYTDGDLLNYYHVGVVTGTAPLEITHCTSSGNISGIKRDSTTKGWTHVGEMRGVGYALNNTEHKEETPMQKATVAASNGEPVRMRKAPGTDAVTLAKLQVGTVVEVPEKAGEWATVVAPDGKRGYMMTKFLTFDDEVPVHDGADMPEEIAPEPETDDNVFGVNLALPKSAAMELYRALMKVVDG